MTETKNKMRTMMDAYYDNHSGEIPTTFLGVEISDLDREELEFALDLTVVELERARSRATRIFERLQS